MEIKELKEKKENDLHRLLAETRDKLRELRFKDANKQLKNIREIREGKKTVAKILTLFNSKKDIEETSKDDDKDKVND
ncbi:MAG: 50S ribosomal protein L29 [Patescibacteria group bacterium]|nr:50S ribosomal protein L29 [Patescibacteria group bacterium]